MKKMRLDISLFELLQIVIKQWKIMFAVIVVFVILLSGYGFLSAHQSNHSNQNSHVNEQYETELEIYNSAIEVQGMVTPVLKQAWIDSISNQINHPLMTLNPYCCSYNQIALLFPDNTAEKYKPIVQNWIEEADDEKIFGEKSNNLSVYKTDLILVNNEGDYVAVYLVQVDSYDTDQAAKYLVKFLKAQADNADIDISEISSSNRTGLLSDVLDYQRNVRENINEINNVLQNVKKTTEVFPAPVNPNASRSSYSFVKLIIIGILLGIVIGILIIILRTILVGSIISRRQVEDIFELPMLSDCSRNSSVAIEILNSNLDIMTKENNKVMVIGIPNSKIIDDLVASWNLEGKRTFLSGSSITEDPDTIEALHETDGIVAAVEIGRSKLEDLQVMMVRASKLDVKILGFIII